MNKRKFRYINKGHGKDSLSDHEIAELDIHFDISTEGYHVLAPLTKKEWLLIKKTK